MPKIGQDALERAYRFGYSFKNPPNPKVVTNAKPVPWFNIMWAPEGPTEVRERLFTSGKLPEYPAIWRRAAKQINAAKLGIEGLHGVELRDFHELGQAPGATQVSGSTSRGFWGSLSSALTTTASFLTAREQAKLAQETGQDQTDQSSDQGVVQQVTQVATNYWPYFAVGGIGIAIAVYMMYGRK